MPSSSRHRGPDPEDERSFGVARHGDLRAAVQDVCWLLDRGYGIASAAELAGNRYHLTRRQRIAVGRCACSSVARLRRRQHHVPAADLKEQPLWIDGFNVLTAVESAIGGGVILLGRDGCCRDVAGVYSHYRQVAETLPALHAIGRMTAHWGVAQCRWWLDRPVFNSGRLQTAILQVAASAGWSWEVDLVPNPDRVLTAATEIISTSDHVILDHCQRWFNLAREVIAHEVYGANLLDLSGEAPHPSPPGDASAAR